MNVPSQRVQYVPGTMFLFDTSALSRTTDDKVWETVATAIDDGVAATCLTVDLEMQYSARTAQQLRQIMAFRHEHYVQLAITSEIEQRARRIQSLLARNGLHRAAGPIDILTAAVAEHYRAIVVHYNADFEHIASVTGQQHRWIVPRGSIS